MNDVTTHTENHLREETTPWAMVTIPAGYQLRHDGVYKLDGDNLKRISGAIWISAKTRNTNQSDWGTVLHWYDHDGHHHEKAFPDRRLYDSRSTLPQDLAAEGLAIVCGQEKALIKYLTEFETDARHHSVTRLGWTDHDTLTFVLLDQKNTRVIGHNTGQQSVIFQPEKNLPNLASMHARGTLADWKNHIAIYCRGNPVLNLTLCAGFGAPLLRFMETEGGVFHIHGSSSTGKTTALQVGASIWGNGSDPGATSMSHIRRWNTTSNALEATAAAHNDTLLLLDEMGSCDAQDFGKVIYDLVSGQGKSRLTKDAELKEQRFSRVLALSTGEISLADRMGQEPKRKMLAGHQTRFVDIATSGNIIIHDHGLGTRELATRLKQNCGQYYGVAGAQFVGTLINLYETSSRLRQVVRQQVEHWTKHLKNNRALAPHQERALQRFALLLTAGIMASDMDILPIPSSELQQSFEALVAAWITHDMPEEKRGVQNVIRFFLRNEARFGSASDPNNRPRDLAGYYDRKMGRIYFTDEGFEEACCGCNPAKVFDEIRAMGFAALNDPNRRKCKISIRQTGEITLRPCLIGVQASLMEQE